MISTVLALCQELTLPAIGMTTFFSLQGCIPSKEQKL